MNSNTLCREANVAKSLELKTHPEQFQTMAEKLKSGAAGDSLATHLHLVLWRASKAVEAVAYRSIEATGWCRSDFAVLEALLHKGEMPVNALGKHVLLTSGSITTAVDRLAGRDLVVRRQSPDDGRVWLVGLTAGGRRAISKAFAAHESTLAEAMSAIPERDKAELIDRLRTLGKTVADWKPS